MLVSVIIPCYNVRAYLEACVQSVLTQDHPDLEIILVDNNSTDGTRDLMLHLSNQHPEIIHCIKETAQGAPAARNAGLKIARGEWIQFLDADDRLFPHKISRQLKHKNDADLIISPYFEKTASKKIILYKINNNIWAGLATGQAGVTSSLLFRRSFFDIAGNWKTALQNHQEYELMLRFAKKSARAAFDNKSQTLKIERSKGSISISNKESYAKNVINIILDIVEHLQKDQPKQLPDFIKYSKSQLFYLLRHYYRQDQPEALKIFNQHLNKPGFLGRQSFLYKLVFKIMGFRYTEKLLSLFR
jgi:glycosyltransferase involved in cell wall biosynthesis